MNQSTTYIFASDVKDLTIECLIRLGYEFMNNKDDSISNDIIINDIRLICQELVHRKTLPMSLTLFKQIDEFLYYTISPNYSNQ